MTFSNRKVILFPWKANVPGILRYTNLLPKSGSPLALVKFLTNSRPNSIQGRQTPVHLPHLNKFSPPMTHSLLATNTFTLLCARVLCIYFIYFLFDCNSFEESFSMAYTDHLIGTNWLN